MNKVTLFDTDRTFSRISEIAGDALGKVGPPFHESSNDKNKDAFNVLHAALCAILICTKE